MRKIKAICSCCGYAEIYPLTNAEADKLDHHRELGMIQDILPEVPAWIRSYATCGFGICPVCSGAERVRTKHDMTVLGWGFIPQGTEFKISKANTRFVYAELNPHVFLKLARKGDCEIIG